MEISEKQKKYDELILKFEKYCHSNSCSLFNEDLKKLKTDEIRYIVLGDNPGNNEKDLNRYFVGKSGIALRSLFEAKLVEKFSSEVLVLNKTSFPSTTTKELWNMVFSNKIECLFIKDQVYMAHFLKELNEILEIRILIFGTPKNYESIGITNTETTPFATFFKYLRKFNSFENIFFFNHPSMLCLFESITIEMYEDNCFEKYLFDLGSNRRKEIIGNKKNLALR